MVQFTQLGKIENRTRIIKELNKMKQKELFHTLPKVGLLILYLIDKEDNKIIDGSGSTILTKITNYTYSHVLGLVSILEGIGFLERDKNNKRTKSIRLTEKGQEFININMKDRLLDRYDKY